MKKENDPNRHLTDRAILDTVKRLRKLGEGNQMVVHYNELFRARVQKLVGGAVYTAGKLQPGFMTVWDGDEWDDTKHLGLAEWIAEDYDDTPPLEFTRNEALYSYDEEVGF